MLKFTLTRNGGFAVAVASASLLALSSHQRRAFGQNAASAPVPAYAAAGSTRDVEGSGVQLRVLAAVYAAWSQAPPPKVGNDSPDLATYHFRIAASGANYVVTLWPNKPIIRRIPMPAGVRLESESSTFFFTVRSNDFKVVERAAIM